MDQFYLSYRNYRAYFDFSQPDIQLSNTFIRELFDVENKINCVLFGYVYV